MIYKNNINLTFSKWFSLIILIMGSVYAFVFKDQVVMVTTITIAGGLAGAKAIKGDLDNEKN